MSEDVFDMNSEPTEGTSVDQLGVLGDLKSLEILNLARNQMTKLCINEFMGNYNLKQLNITQNRIRKMLNIDVYMLTKYPTYSIMQGWYCIEH